MKFQKLDLKLILKLYSYNMLQKKKRIRKVLTKRFKRIKFYCNSYFIEKKQQVISYIIKNGKNEAVRHFNLDNSMVNR